MSINLTAIINCALICTTILLMAWTGRDDNKR